MVKIELSETYERTAEDVFAVLIDVPNYPRWQPGVVRASLGSAGTFRTGTQIREVRRMYARQAEVVLTVAEYAYPRRLGFDVAAGATRARISVTLKPVWGGTQVLVHGEAHPAGTAQRFETLFARSLLGQLRGALRGLGRAVKAVPAAES